MNDLTAQERAARITWLLANGERLTTQRIMELTGIRSREGVWFLMTNLSRAIPIFCNEEAEWCKLDQR